MAMNIGIRSSNMTIAGGPTLLLDNYASNLIAVYSLRRLRGGYSGHAIRVKRSSDGTTQDIGFVSDVLDTAALATFVGAGTGYVTVWYDQSGNALNLDTVASDATSPVIRTSGTTEVDAVGNPRIKFTASATQRIYRGSSMNVSFFCSSSNGANTTVLVIKTVYDASYPYPTPFCLGDGSVNPRCLMHLPYATDLYYDHGNNGSCRVNVAYPVGYFDQAVNIFGLRATGSQEYIRLNGTQLINTAYSGSFTDAAKRFSLGANYGGAESYNSQFNGFMQEVIIWNNDIGATQLTEIENDCIAFYT